jgi:hypothetical protein
MKEETVEEDFQSDVEINDDQSWKTTQTIPFANFYKTKQTQSNCSNSQYKLSEQLANTSSKIYFIQIKR